MNAVRKSFLLSLMFHIFIGSAAYLTLIRQHPPELRLEIPLKHMNIVAITYTQPSSKKVQSSEQPSPLMTAQQHAPTPTQTQTPTKSFTPEPTIASKATVAPMQSVSVPMVSTSQTAAPLAMKQSQQHIQEAIPAPSKQKSDLSNEKKAFFSSLKSNIQNHLRYPSTARRRGIEGDVEVRFTLSSKGDINNISIQRGKEIFHHEAIAAINAVSGINIPKNLIEIMPMEIELTLEFNLNNQG